MSTPSSFAQGHPETTLARHEEKLRRFEHEFGQNHQSTLFAAGDLGYYYLHAGRHAEAAVNLGRAVSGLERILGRKHQTTLNFANGLALCYSLQGRAQEAEETYIKTLNDMQSILGPDHTSTIETSFNVGLFYVREARLDAAEPFLKQAIDGFVTLHGWNHLFTLSAASKLHLIYTNQEKSEEAEKICRGIRAHKGSLLHLAARWADADPLRLILTSGIDVNAMDEPQSRHHPQQLYNTTEEPSGCTALHIATHHGIANAVRELLENGADIDATCFWNDMTPLNIAAARNHIGVARILLEGGANANGKSGAGLPPLLDATMNGHLEMAEVLLKSGANVDEADMDGDPVLHSAAFNNHINIVRLLLEYKADPKCRGGSGRTARWFAAERNHREVVELLRSNGADDQDEPDMLNDSSVKLQSIGTNRILAELEKAQSLISYKSGEQWVQRLRFIVRSTNPEYDLAIVQQDVEDPKEPYVAVSYCWGSPQNPASQKSLTVHDPRKAGLSRPTRASSDTILRSLDFAESCGIKRIWVDQECIDQDDEMDVQAAVQAMHLVYRRAEATIVLLGRHIHCTEDFEALADEKLLYRTSTANSNDQRLRERILGDKWFTRAWCAQEHANASSNNLRFLVGSRHEFDEDGKLWSECASLYNNANGQIRQNVRREWVLSSGFLLNLSVHSLGNPHVMLSFMTINNIGATGRSFTLLESRVEDMPWYQQNSTATRLVMASWKPLDPMNNTKLSIETQQHEIVHPPTSKKLRMSMSQAHAFIRPTKNLLVSDRLAILSNTTHYGSHINIRKATDQKLSYTVCVFSLSLQNGDLKSMRYFRGVKRGATYDSSLGSWLPPLQLSLDTLIPENTTNVRSSCFAGDPCYVIGQKGLFRGLVWDIDAYDTNQFSTMHEVFPEIYPLALKQSVEESDPWRVILLQILIRQLMASRQWELVEIIVLAALPRHLTDPEEMQSILSALDAWISDDDDDLWPNALSRSGNLYDNTRNSGRGRSLNQETPLLKWVYDCIESKKPLPIGKCVIKTETGDRRTLVGLFKVNPAIHKKVFTPLSELEYDFGNWTPLQLLPDYFACIEPSETPLLSEDIHKVTEHLHEESLLADRTIYRVVESEVSNSDLSDAIAVWSHRLSRNGILEKHDHHGWRTISLGQEAGYRWFL